LSREQQHEALNMLGSPTCPFEKTSVNSRINRYLGTQDGIRISQMQRHGLRFCSVTLPVDWTCTLVCQSHLPTAERWVAIRGTVSAPHKEEEGKQAPFAARSNHCCTASRNRCSRRTAPKRMHAPPMESTRLLVCASPQC